MSKVNIEKLNTLHDKLLIAVFHNLDCNNDYFYACNSKDRCIPQEGICDGFLSCPDSSDELNCRKLSLML